MRIEILRYNQNLQIKNRKTLKMTTSSINP